MKLRYKILIGFYSLFFVTPLIQSCCEEESRITAQGGMKAWELYETENGIGRRQISIINGEFILGAYFNEEISWLDNISLINKSYALTCEEIQLNSIDENSLDISIDRSFILNGDTISPNENLLNLENSGVNLHSLAGGWIEFKFTESFFTNSILDSALYNFQFQAFTDDNINLSSEILLTIEK